MLKTKKTVSKRFKITKSGKLMRTKAGKNHFMRRKSSKLKRSINKPHLVSESFSKKIKKVILH